MWEIRSRGGRNWSLITPEGEATGGFQELVNLRKAEFAKRGIDLSAYVGHPKANPVKAEPVPATSCEFCDKPAVFYGDSKVGKKHLCGRHKKLYV